LLGIPFILILSLILAYAEVWVIEHNRDAAGDAKVNEEIPADFNNKVYAKGSPGIDVWEKYRHTGELSLTCQVWAKDSEKHHTVSIYAPADAHWDLSERHSLTFSLLAAHSADRASLQDFCIRLQDGESYYEYKPNKELWETRNQTGWNFFTVPLRESREGWSQRMEGEPALTNIKQIEIHFDADSEMTVILDNIKFQKE